MQMKHSFKKGEVSNPNGRPKGSMNKLKAASLKLREMASEDTDKAYKVLMTALESGEQWAHQIYFKELVPFKKQWLNEISVAGVQRTISNVDDVGVIIAQLTNKLLEDENLPREEIHNLIKTLNSVKLASDFGKMKFNVFEKVPDEKMAIIKGIVAECNGFEL
jgi:hypothetical protein